VVAPDILPFQAVFALTTRLGREKVIPRNFAEPSRLWLDVYW
jgi:hypothetical protein